ncbi:hypothetical protein PAPYR_12101 [Paratrimastix pyriformis]|uniref:Uncharacterized protein n=1 Tax=Paratrimastix pyriformis TaxID=342808 RepID=A0ABQ8U744_9EUKA|nr:hypothetical protein PAPYR_12101 [Paratrimastix pyriformis]
MKLIDLHHQNRYHDVCRVLKSIPAVWIFNEIEFSRVVMNSIDWNQFHTPQEAIEYCEGAIGQDPPKWAEGYQAINWSPAPPPRTPHQERPCPDPYRPEGPDRPDRPILDDDDVPSPPKPKKAAPAAKPKKDREAPKRQEGGPGGRQVQEGGRQGEGRGPGPPARRKPGPPHEAKEAAEAKGSDDAPRMTPGRGTGTSTRPQWRSPPRRPDGRAPRTQGEGRAQAGQPTDPDDFSPEAARQVLHATAEGPCAAELHRPCPSLARPLAYERLGAIVEWFEKLGAAVLFSIIVQTSALDEARYQVVDGSHRFQVARIIVDPRRGGEAQQATPQIRQHLKEDYIDVAVYNTLDPEAMLELQHRVNLLTHDARFGSSTFDVLLNLKRASLQVCRLPSLDYHHPTSPPLSGPKRYIREDPDFATHLEPALKELHFPKGEDAPAKLVKILECFSLEMLCALPAPG